MVKISNTAAAMMMFMVRGWLEKVKEETKQAFPDMEFTTELAQRMIQDGDLHDLPRDVQRSIRGAESACLEDALQLLEKQVMEGHAPGGDDLLDILEKTLKENRGGQLLGGAALRALYEAIFVGGESRDLIEKLAAMKCSICNCDLNTGEVGVLLYNDDDRDFRIRFCCTQCSGSYAQSMRCSTKGCNRLADVPEKVRQVLKTRKCGECVRKEQQAAQGGDKAKQGQQEVPAADNPFRQWIVAEHPQAGERPPEGGAAPAPWRPFRRPAW